MANQFQSRTYEPNASLGVSETVQGVQIYAGAGAPTISAPKGSLYSNTTGSSTSTRLYVNTDGATTWASVTTSA